MTEATRMATRGTRDGKQHEARTRYSTGIHHTRHHGQREGEQGKQGQEQGRAKSHLVRVALLPSFFFLSRFAIDRLHRHRGQRDSLSLCPLGCFGLRFSFVCWSPFYLSDIMKTLFFFLCFVVCPSSCLSRSFPIRPLQHCTAYPWYMKHNTPSTHPPEQKGKLDKTTPIVSFHRKQQKKPKQAVVKIGLAAHTRKHRTRKSINPILSTGHSNEDTQAWPSYSRAGRPGVPCSRP